MSEEEIMKTEELKDSTDVRWFVIHTYSGYENKVKDNIIKTVKNRSMEDQILRISVPEAEVAESKEAKKKETKDGITTTEIITKTLIKKVKIFPGYVFINMMMNDQTWYVVRNTRGVTSFVGPGSKPVALNSDEVYNMDIEKYAERTDYDETQEIDDIVTGATPEVELDFEIGDTVMITSGSFANSEGQIQEIHVHKQTVIVSLFVLGRETPSEFDFNQIKKV